MNWPHFAQHTLQEVALIFMAVVYTTRLIWLLRFTAGKERQAPTGKGSIAPRGSIIYSWANIAMPWAMESSRSKIFLYLQFVFFHVGVVTAIGLSFVLPYVPGLMESPVISLFIQATCAIACLIGVMRIVRRFGSLHMRAISTPDDYFSLLLLTGWFLFAFLTSITPNAHIAPNWSAFPVMTSFFLTAFFLIYVPFSKISHYLYYPFTRYYLGKTMGRRGVYPMTKGSQSTSATQH